MPLNLPNILILTNENICITLGPGNKFVIITTSSNSAEVSQLYFSTEYLLAIGIIALPPPKLIKDIFKMNQNTFQNKLTFIFSFFVKL